MINQVLNNKPKRITMSMREFLHQPHEVMISLKIIIYTFFTFLGIETGVVEVLFILMSIDTALGAVKALRLGYKFSFPILFWGVTVKLLILTVPMILALTAKGLSFDFKWFVIATLNILIVAESFSAISNILSIKTKKNIKNVDFIAMLLKSIRNGLYNIIKNLLNTIEIKSLEITKNMEKKD